MCLKTSIKQIRNHNKGVYQLAHVEVCESKLLQIDL